MRRITVSAKLAIAVAVPLLSLLAMATTFYAHSNRVDRALANLVDVDEPLVDAAYAIEANTLKSGFASLGYIHDRDPIHRERMQNELLAYQLALDRFQSLAATDQRREQVERLGVLGQTYRKLAESLLDETDVLAMRLEEFNVALEEIDTTLDERLQPSVKADDPQALAKLHAVMELEVNVNGIAKGVQQLMTKRTAEAQRRIDEDTDDFRRFLKEYRDIVVDEEEMRLADEVEKGFERAVALAHEIVDLRHARDTRIDELVVVSNAFEKLVEDEIIEDVHAALRQQQASVREMASKAYMLTIATVLISLCVGGGIGFVVVRGLRDSVGRLVDGSKALGRGELDYRMEVRSNDELQDVAEAFNQMATDLDSSHNALRQSNRELERRVAKRTEDLSRSNANLEQFAYVASHDLQEPLRKVASCCQALAEDYADKLDDEGREWIAFAVDGATRMRRLVSDLLEFSRVSTRGKAAEPTDANRACQAALNNLAAAVEERDAQIVCRPLPTVLADAGQLAQLFQNLVGNSIKYCRDDQPVIEIGAEPSDDLWQFYIKDNGIGIAPEFHERIFQIFQRLHRQDEYPGTGVGLAICRRVVERLGGKLWVQSQSGQGSTFFFTLPAVSSINERRKDNEIDIRSNINVG